jgi:hypothetical protein
MKNNLKYQAICLFVLIIVFGGLFLQQSISAQQSNNDLLKKLKSDPGMPLAINNSLEAPVVIIEAFSKEISSADFRVLTGSSAKSEVSISFPEVKMLNTSGKVITSFSLVMQMKDSSGSFYWTRLSGLEIEPNDSFSVTSSQWVGSMSVRTRDGKVEKVARDLTASEMWVPGYSSAASVFIVDMKFSDGTEWKVKGKN